MGLKFSSSVRTFRAIRFKSTEILQTHDQFAFLPWMNTDSSTEVIYRLSNGKLIYKEINHPAHNTLTVGELQNVAFHFYDEMVQAHLQLQIDALTLPLDFNLAKVRYQTYKMHYTHFNKLWRSALIAAKKTR